MVLLGHLPEEQLGLAIKLEGFQEPPLPQFELLLVILYLEPDLPPSECNYSHQPKHIADRHVFSNLKNRKTERSNLDHYIAQIIFWFI